MRIELKKFGTLLISRQAGKEALATFQSMLRGIDSAEKLEVDFEGVITFCPSWADEFLTPLANQFGDGLVLRPTENLSVKATLKNLEEIRNQKM